MREKETILLVHNYYQVPGGEDTVVANEKAMLEEQGYKVLFYSRNNREIKSFSFVRKALLLFTTIFNPRTFIDVRKIIKKESVDIVHVHNTLNLISPAVYYAALSCNVPVVQTVHNFRFLCPAGTLYRDNHICEDCLTSGLKCSIKHGCYRQSRVQTLVCVLSTCIHRMTGVYGRLNYICLTEFNKRKLLNLRQINPNMVYIKPNFSECVQDKVVPYIARKNQVAFVGRIDHLKGIDFLLGVWKKWGVNAPRLIVCGTGPLQKWCEEFIASNNLKNIEYRGFVSNSEAKNIIAESKALILPTQWYEGFPMTIVEAYSVGTPVIGPQFGNVGSLIEDGITGYTYQPNQAESIIEAINKLNDLTHTVYTDYKTHYTKKINYERLEQIYQSIVLDNTMADKK